MHHIPDLVQFPGEHLSALCNIHSLTLHDTSAEHVTKEFPTCFSAFRETLTYLSLTDFATSFGAFVTLVGCFPNMTTLRVDSLKLEPDEGPVPQLSQPLRGEIRVHEFPGDLEFFSRLSGLDLEYEKLVIVSTHYHMVTIFLESALQISPNSVKFLRLTAELRCE